MAGVNKAIILGRLGQDPEIRYFQDGTAVANFSVATSETWNDKQSGEKKEKTEWHRIVAHRRLAEICGQYLTKGSQVYIEGKIETRQWTDKEGQTRYTTQINASTMQMLGGNQSGSQAPNHPPSAAPQQRYAQQAPQAQQYAQPAAPQQQQFPPPGAGYGPPDDDIPF